MITRRKFLKHLAYVTSAIAVAPRALIAENIEPAAPEWVWIDVVLPLSGQGISGDSALDEAEERLRFKKVRVNPLFQGKIGIYEGVTIHQHR